jgi:hypothetical protein
MASKKRAGRPLLIAKAGIGLTVASCWVHPESPPYRGCEPNSCEELGYGPNYVCDTYTGECVPDQDAGTTLRTDAGSDAGPNDAGGDAGDDAGRPDSGDADGGTDGGDAG